MQNIFHSTKKLISIYLAILLLFTSTLIICPATARADGNISTANTPTFSCITIDKEKLEQIKATNNGIFQSEDIQALTAIAGVSSATAGLGSVTVLTWTTAAHGIMALLGAGTTTVVALPVAGVVATGGLLGYGGYKVVKYFQDQNVEKTLPLCDQSLKGLETK